MFTVELEFQVNEQVSIEYHSIEECLGDRILQKLFDAKMITSCTIKKGIRRIAGIPIMTWTRFVETVSSNRKVLV